MNDPEPPVQIQLPRFSRAMKTLAAVYVVVWLLELLLQGTGIGGFHGTLGPFEPLALVPASVVQRGHVWQLATYAFLHDPSGALSVLFTVGALWFMGSSIEGVRGARAVFALIGAATLVGALAAIAAGTLDASIFRGLTYTPSASNSALVAAWCLLNARERVSLFGLAKLTGAQLLGLAAVITTAQFVWQRSGAGAAAIAGLGVGWAFARWRTSRADPPGARRRESGPRFRVIRGGADDLPN